MYPVITNGTLITVLLVLQIVLPCPEIWDYGGQGSNLRPGGPKSDLQRSPEVWLKTRLWSSGGFAWHL
jgi:hypothetical protein